MSAITDLALQAAPSTEARGYWATVGRRIRRDKVSIACAFILLLIFISALLAPWLGLADPYQGSMIRRLRHIGTPNYPLGTDELGRDMLARLIYGGRLSLLIGILPVILAFVIGTSLGLVAGYVGGRINTAIMRTIDVFYAFPSVLLAIAISGALGAGIVNSIVSLTIVFVPQITRVAESVTTGVRNMDFVEAARASGAGPFTIMRVHMLGNVLGPIFVYATGLISVSMILAAGLSFLGLGTKPPEPEWGLMLNTLRTAIYVNPWVAALPGVMIFMVSICFNLLSDGLRSAMDIRNCRSGERETEQFAFTSPLGEATCSGEAEAELRLCRGDPGEGLRLDRAQAAHRNMLEQVEDCGPDCSHGITNISRSAAIPSARARLCARSTM